VRHGKKPLTQGLGAASTVKINATRWTIPLPKYTVNRESDNEIEIISLHKWLVFKELYGDGEIGRAERALPGFAAGKVASY
jgi:hypothetical protein